MNPRAITLVRTITGFGVAVTAEGGVDTLAADVLRRAGFRTFTGEDPDSWAVSWLPAREVNRRAQRTESMLRANGYDARIEPPIATEPEPDLAEDELLDSPLLALAGSIHNRSDAHEIASDLMIIVNDQDGVMELAAEALATAGDWIATAHQGLPDDLSDVTSKLTVIVELYRHLNAAVADSVVELVQRTTWFDQSPVHPALGSRFASFSHDPSSAASD